MPYRIERVNSLIRREISELLQRQVKDPRLSNFVTATEVSTSPDFKHAKVYISFIGSDEERENTLNVLSSASGYFRRELAEHLKLRRIPELKFLWDDSIERADHLLRLIDQVNLEQDGT